MADVVVRPLGPFNRGSDTPCRTVVTPGGSAANQAVAMVAAGATAHLVGLVGDDELGRAAARALERQGVHPHLRVVPGRHTGVVVALVDRSGQRSMLTDRGANLCLSRDDLAGVVPVPGGHLHLSGYELLDEQTRPAGLAALELAGKEGMTRSVDPCSAGPLATVGGAAFLGWAQGCDWCCANLEEGRALTGRSEPTAVLGALRRSYGEVVLTLGPDGALWSGPGTGVVHRRALAAAVADTTGAGDAFTGTFLARRLMGDEPQDALQAALEAAARAVAVPGARSWD